MVGSNYELTVISKYIQIIDNAESVYPVNRKLIAQISFGAFFLGLLVLLLNYVVIGTEALLHGAYYMILLGLGSTITFGMMLLCDLFNHYK